jgi:hypothetical protein
MGRVVWKMFVIVCLGNVERVLEEDECALQVRLNRFLEIDSNMRVPGRRKNSLGGRRKFRSEKLEILSGSSGTNWKKINLTAGAIAVRKEACQPSFLHPNSQKTVLLHDTLHAHKMPRPFMSACLDVLSKFRPGRQSFGNRLCRAYHDVVLNFILHYICIVVPLIIQKQYR